MHSTTPLESLLLKLEGILPENLLEEVSDFLYAQEDEIKNQESLVDGLESDVEDLEEEVSQQRSRKLTLYDVEVWVGNARERDQQTILDLLDLPIIQLSTSSDLMQGIYIHKLEEYFRSNSAEDTYLKLTTAIDKRDHDQEVQSWENYVGSLQTQLDTAQNELHDAQYYAGKNN